MLGTSCSNRSFLSVCVAMRCRDESRLRSRLADRWHSESNEKKLAKHRALRKKERMLHAAQAESVLSSLRPRSQEIVVISFTRHQKNLFKIEGLVVSTTPEQNVKKKKKKSRREVSPWCFWNSNAFSSSAEDQFNKLVLYPVRARLQSSTIVHIRKPKMCACFMIWEEAASCFAKQHRSRNHIIRCRSVNGRDPRIDVPEPRARGDPQQCPNEANPRNKLDTTVRLTTSIWSHRTHTFPARERHSIYLEDDEALIKLFIGGQSSNMRHVGVNTTQWVADGLTTGSFSQERRTH